MRIDELKADEFMAAMAQAAEAVEAIMGSESGKALWARFGKYRGSLQDVPEDERRETAGREIVGMALAALPGFCKENGDAVYSLLAACDGQGLAEYKESFTPAKMLVDAKALADWALSHMEDVTAFLGR